KVILADEIKRREYGNAPFPYRRGLRKNVKRAPVSLPKEGPYDIWRRPIHQIPVVDERSVSNVEVVNLLSNVFVCACKLSHTNHQSHCALFMNLRFQEALQSFQRRILKLRREFA